MISYIAWGTPGTHAAVTAGIWGDSLEYFPAEIHVHKFNADYTKNTFFRLRSNKLGVNTSEWFCFTSNDDPSDLVSIPMPIRTSANEPVLKQIPGDNNVLFSWLPVDGVDSYRLIVRNQNGNDIYNQVTSSTSVVLQLVPGNYSWTVLGGEEFENGEIC